MFHYSPTCQHGGHAWLARILRIIRSYRQPRSAAAPRPRSTPPPHLCDPQGITERDTRHATRH
eukprot:scaffold2483_cov135-Isochrysis_galbana.AAC.6